ncbi:hypothetical protein CDIK_1075 [Cucumispora dikerogammari]|nr:hypothetical protein CDIK_1075 [Cucumispora dikerogammari]
MKIKMDLRSRNENIIEDSLKFIASIKTPEDIKHLVIYCGSFNLEVAAALSQKIKPIINLRHIKIALYNECISRKEKQDILVKLLENIDLLAIQSFYIIQDFFNEDPPQIFRKFLVEAKKIKCFKIWDSGKNRKGVFALLESLLAGKFKLKYLSIYYSDID